MIKLSHKVSLAELFDGVDKSGAAARSPDLEKMAFLLCRGGWPAACDLKGDVALNRAFSYVDAVVKSDISRVDGVRRDETRARRLMRSYARLQGTQATAAATGEYAYRRPDDGVIVCPLSALRP